MAVAKENINDKSLSMIDVNRSYFLEFALFSDHLSYAENRMMKNRGVQDLEGNFWLFSQHVQDVNPADWGAQVARLS